MSEACYRDAHEQASREMMERFDPLTPENFRAATDWQHDRIKELVRYREACEQAYREMVERYGRLTADNFIAATNWHGIRVKELTR